MSYPPPMAPVPTGPPRLRGRTPLRLGIIFLILGVAGVVAGGLIGFNGALKKVDAFQRIDVSSSAITSGSITFDTGGYVAYYEASHIDTSALPGLTIELTPPGGRPRTLDTPYGGTSGGNRVKTLTYDYDGHNGAALYQFSIPTAGTYHVRIDHYPDALAGTKVAFGRSIGKSTIAGGLLIVVGIALLVAGIVLLIVGLVKRSNSKKEIAAAQHAYYSGVPPPGYGYPQQYPQQYPPPQQGFAPPPRYTEQQRPNLRKED